MTRTIPCRMMISIAAVTVVVQGCDQPDDGQTAETAADDTALRSASAGYREVCPGAKPPKFLPASSSRSFIDGPSIGRPPAPAEGCRWERCETQAGVRVPPNPWPEEDSWGRRFTPACTWTPSDPPPQHLNYCCTGQKQRPDNSWYWYGCAIIFDAYKAKKSGNFCGQFGGVNWLRTEYVECSGESYSLDTGVITGGVCGGI